jgi:hypothetical protein
MLPLEILHHFALCFSAKQYSQIYCGQRNKIAESTYKVAAQNIATYIANAEPNISTATQNSSSQLALFAAARTSKVETTLSSALLARAGYSNLTKGNNSAANLRVRDRSHRPREAWSQRSKIQ